MSSTSASSTTSTNPTNTYSDLFPSASTSASAVGPVGGTGSNVYYLVVSGLYHSILHHPSRSGSVIILLCQRRLYCHPGRPTRLIPYIG
jgi:hypothetical protein